MANKFSEFLKTHAIDQRRLLAVSRDIERLRPEDRALRLARRQARATEGAEKPAGKARSGRPVTPRLLAKANAGQPVTGPAKSRLLRAVNRILEQKKKDPIDLRVLF
jgi:hypothetical protein